MALSEETKNRAFEALAALKQVQDAYADVLVVLDYVNILDIAKFELDSDDGGRADDVLGEKELRSVLWHVGKRVGGFEASADMLPALVQFAVDENERQRSEVSNEEAKDAE